MLVLMLTLLMMSVLFWQVTLSFFFDERYESVVHMCSLSDGEFYHARCAKTWHCSSDWLSVAHCYTWRLQCSDFLLTYTFGNW
ncbi:hypothetical protein BDU57DRAFT_514641 [Ampelomyces quisqualis]|uniref:Secreted protein n=1 Tax=Ampelomyces quisqualis TaxID=50730 RepID=A0A6A5QRS7_AMPQU|nr:hypothetical protein BDU57DRAFT_514641 [Ampelomyces quisqualis]